MRVPDIKYKSCKKEEEKISEEDSKNITLEENDYNTDKCACDINSECLVEKENKIIKAYMMRIKW